MEFVILCLCLVLYFGYVNGQIIQLPGDVASRVGDDVTLTCRVDDTYNGGFEWKELISSLNGTRIYHNQDLNITSDPTKYAIIGRYDLQIKDVALTDGGLYRCSDDVTSSEGMILVYDNFEIATMGLLENELGNMTFSARFSAIINFTNPVVNVSVNGLPLSGVQSNFTTISTVDQQSVYELFGFCPHAPRIDDVIVCVVSDATDGVPSFSHSITLNETNVQYGPRNLRTSVDDRIYTEGSLIFSAADANPPASYVWTAIQSPTPPESRTVYGAVLDITLDMVEDIQDTDNIWMCTARNIHGSTAVNVTFTVGLYYPEVTNTEDYETTEGQTTDFQFIEETSLLGTTTQNQNLETTVTTTEKESTTENDKSNKYGVLLPVVIAISILFVISIILLVVVFVKYRRTKLKQTNLNGEYLTTIVTQASGNRHYENSPNAPVQLTFTNSGYEQVDLNDPVDSNPDGRLKPRQNIPNVNDKNAPKSQFDASIRSNGYEQMEFNSQVKQEDDKDHTSEVPTNQNTSDKNTSTSQLAVGVASHSHDQKTDKKQPSAMKKYRDDLNKNVPTAPFGVSINSDAYEQMGPNTPWKANSGKPPTSALPKKNHHIHYENAPTTVAGKTKSGTKKQPKLT